MRDVSQMLNIKFTSQQTQPTCDTTAIDGVKAPESYNFYEDHSDCRHEIEMQKMSSSYVEAHHSAYRNRYCLRKLGEDFTLSLDYNFYCD